MAIAEGDAPVEVVAERLARATSSVLALNEENWLRERFPDKDWHRHRRTDGRTDLCDGTPSDCAEKVRL